MTDAPPLAILVSAAKRYGACVALAGATLKVRRGTIHAVVGENGAGKTTLLRVVFGLIRPDRGALAVNGVDMDLARYSPAVARERGVGMVQQHGALVPSLSVVENAVLGREGGLLVDLDAPAEALARTGTEVGLGLDPRAIVEELPVAVRQRAEIVGQLAAGAEILILDEPTAVLAPVEVDGLFATLRRLRDAGTTVVLVTHKLGEVRAIADEITVLRRGRTVATFAGNAPVAEVARAIVGGAVIGGGASPVRAHVDTELALEVRGLAVGTRLRGVDLAVRAGEIVGVAGVEGNGQTELVEAIAGLIEAQGSVRIAGRDAPAGASARQARGLAHIPEDRHARGLVLDASVTDNIALGRRDLGPGFWRRADLERRAAEQVVADFAVRPADVDARAGGLSGGNQQKLVVGRELGRPGLKAVVAAQPTRGVDLGAVALIHRRLREVAAAGAGVLVVSADLDELMELADRIVVVFRGEIVGEVARGEAGARERVGAWMTGAVAEAEAATEAETEAEAEAGTEAVAEAETVAGAGEGAGEPDSEALTEAPARRGIRELQTSLVAILLVFAAGSLLMLIFGESPARVWGAMFARILGDQAAGGAVLYKATALCFTGLAVALALDAGLFNIGVEGQVIAGTLACAVAGGALPAGTPAVIAVPVCVIAAALAGGAIGALTGVMRAYRGAHEVITGIMLNEVIAGAALWIGNSIVFAPGSTRSAPIVGGAQLDLLGLGGSPASTALMVAIDVAAVVWVLRARSRWGARWRAVGANPTAAETLGIGVPRLRVAIMAGSGAIAGLAATSLVLGDQHVFQEGLGRGVGYLGVAVGLLGRRHPLGIVIAALVLGFLSQGGLEVSDLVPKELTELLIGLAVLAVAVAEPLVARLARRA